MSTYISSIISDLPTYALAIATCSITDSMIRRVADKLFSLREKRAKAQELQEQLTVHNRTITDYSQAIKDLTFEERTSNARAEIERINSLHPPLAASIKNIEGWCEETINLVSRLLCVIIVNNTAVAQDLFNWATAPAPFDGLGALQILHPNATETQLGQIAQNLIISCAATTPTTSCLNALAQTAQLCLQLKRRLHPDLHRGAQQYSIFQNAYRIITEICPKRPPIASSEHLNLQVQKYNYPSCPAFN